MYHMNSAYDSFLPTTAQYNQLTVTLIMYHINTVLMTLREWSLITVREGGLQKKRGGGRAEEVLTMLQVRQNKF